MSVVRVNKTKDYVVMSNNHFKQKDMSLKAKGLLSEMLSLPDDWDYSIDGLVSINKENKTSIKSTLDELKMFGYVKVTKIMPNETKSGRIEYIYDIYENPKQDSEKQGTENLGVEFLGIENHTLYNINNKNINNINIKENIKRKEFVPPTLEEIEKYIKEKQLNVDAKNFYNYFTADENPKLHWIDSKGNKVKNWKQKLITWGSYNKDIKKENIIPEWFKKEQRKEDKYEFSEEDKQRFGLT